MQPELKKGDKVITHLGVGVVEHFELLPALQSEDPRISYVDEIPADALSAWESGRTWCRVGVVGTSSGVVPVAYFNVSEVTPYIDVEASAGEKTQPKPEMTDTQEAAGSGLSSRALFCVRYIAPDGSETKWEEIADFDKLKRDEIAKNRERRKGSWFAQEAGKGHFRI